MLDNVLGDVELLAAITKLAEENKLLDWFVEGYAYPWQREFFRAGSFATQRLVMAGNGCITPWTVIETESQERRIVDIVGSTGFDVRSWDGESECVSQAHGVFLKSIEPAFRFLLDNGEFFDCNGTHRVLTSEGWIAADQLVRASSGLRWRQTVQDYWASCGMGDRLCGGRLLLASGIGQASLPSQADVQRPFLLTFELEGVAERISRHSRAYQGHGPLSTDGYARLILDLCAQFEDPSSCIDALRKSETHQECLRFAGEFGRSRSVPVDADRRSFSEAFWACLNESSGVSSTPEDSDKSPRFLPQSTALFGVGEASLGLARESHYTEIFYPYQHPELIGGRKIVAIVPLGFQPILDFTVEKTHCYFASGVIHHNTGKSQTICAELAMHLTGRYPNWWDGVRFDYGGWEAWVGSIDNDMQRRGPQRALLGRDLSQLGTGLIPADALADKGPRLRQAGVKDVIDTIVINHSSGRPVTLKFLTFEQGWRKWQSGDPKIILWDEEPDETNVEQKDILAEALTRLVRNNGIFMAGYTPLLGETQLTRHFMDSTDSGVWWIGATWDDAPHMDEEQKKRIESQYPAHQREARTKGIPMVGEGLIFQVPESSLVIDPIHIPDHWARICGVDFGMSHPAAAAWLAWDRDTKTIYLYDCWREANTTLEKQAKVIKARGDWIPVSWPHDGEKRDPKSGQRFADILREHGVNVLSKSARYKNDTGGPQPQWPVIEDLRELMEAGQFRVFRTCKPWLEEYRSYHIKDGQIVSRRDDALKASFYAKMMLRYAVSEREGRRAFVTQSAPAPFTTAVH